MPIRLLNGAEVMFAAGFGFLATILGAADIEALQSGAIWDKSQFRLFCMMGSIGGAFLAIAILPAREGVGNYSKRLAIKFAASGISGLLFTPMVIRWQGWPVDSDVILAVSAMVALVSTSIISALVPWFVSTAKARMGDVAPTDKPTP